MPTALVVDDAADIRLLQRELLERAGFTVFEADSGHSALDVVRDARPDVVVLDVQMPDMDGWATLKSIRGLDGAGAVPVVLCTVKSHPSDSLRAWELGCDGYLAKPFTISELVNEVIAVASRPPEQRATIRKARVAQFRLEVQAASLS